MIRILLGLAVVLLWFGNAARAMAADPPNILWMVVDDMSANLGCYGEKTIQTPHLDRLAREGTRFTHAFTTCPVCSPCRSALITGMYQTTIGAHHHRSGRGMPIGLPTGVVPIPVLFRQAGYHTCIGSGVPGNQALGKTDYNFVWDKAMYDSADWSDRKPGQPFFMQVQLPGGKLRDGNGWVGLEKRMGDRATRPESVTLPPHYPDDPALRRDWALYLDAVRETDAAVGQVVARLEQEKLLDSTLLIFVTDHGISHARGKQFLYDEGTHVPMILRGPGVPAGAVREDLVTLIDLAPTSLAVAGIPIPATVQGKNILAAGYKPRREIFAARDRCDETVDRIRSVRDGEWLYIRNFYPQRPMLQPCRYKDQKPTLTRLRELHAAGRLSPLQERLLFSPTRPAEELYRWREDRWQHTNLAAQPDHAATLTRLRARLDAWMEETNDQGRQTESQQRYDAEMAVYLRDLKGQNTEDLQANIATMKRWAAEGK
jgi:arylsulfatase A-like enzyme